MSKYQILLSHTDAQYNFEEIAPNINLLPVAKTHTPGCSDGNTLLETGIQEDFFCGGGDLILIG